MFTLKQIKQIAKKIKANDRWVNDSHSSREYMGICDGLDMLVENLEELVEEEAGMQWENIEDIWPDYPSKEDFFFNEEEY